MGGVWIGIQLIEELLILRVDHAEQNETLLRVGKMATAAGLS